MIARQRLVILILLGVILILELLYVTLQVQVATYGIDYAEIQDELRVTQEEGYSLREQLYTIESLGHIDAEARKQGFVPAKSVYLHN